MNIIESCLRNSPKYSIISKKLYKKKAQNLQPRTKNIQAAQIAVYLIKINDIRLFVKFFIHATLVNHSKNKDIMTIFVFMPTYLSLAFFKNTPKKGHTGSV